MKIIVTCLTGLFLVSNAYADCIITPNARKSVKIDAISAPLYDAQGKRYKGCLLQAQGKILGYAKDERLCKTALNATIMVELTYGCCDTGPDSGDLECTLRTKSGLMRPSVHGNGVTVALVS